MTGSHAYDRNKTSPRGSHAAIEGIERAPPRRSRAATTDRHLRRTRLKNKGEFLRFPFSNRLQVPAIGPCPAVHNCAEMKIVLAQAVPSRGIDIPPASVISWSSYTSHII